MRRPGRRRGASLLRRWLAVVGAAGFACLSPASLPAETLEKPRLQFGLPADAASFTAIFVAAKHFWQREGLDIELTSFRGDTEVSQALASDSIDLSVQSLDGLIHLILAGQPVIGFYGGFHQADFAWIAQATVKRWEDLKGGIIGVSAFGSLTDQLTRYALRKHGLEPAKDVQVFQMGVSASGYQALRSGRLTAAIQSPPYKWMGADAGLTLLGTQAGEIAAQWPKHAFLAKRAFIEKHPATLRAVLRAHVAAIRRAGAERDATIDLLVERVKYTRPYAERAYDEVMTAYDERGSFPADMDAFWTIQMMGGDIKEPWPTSRLLDDRFIRSFSDWAPR